MDMRIAPCYKKGTSEKSVYGTFKERSEALEEFLGGLSINMLLSSLSDPDSPKYPTYEKQMRLSSAKDRHGDYLSQIMP